MFRDDQFIPIQGHYELARGVATARSSAAGTLLEHSIHDVDMLRFLVGDDRPGQRATQRTSTATTASRTSPTRRSSSRSGAIGTLTSVWHDNLARPSLRRVEIFCERRYIVIEGDDWFGPVHWTDTDGDEWIDWAATTSWRPSSRCSTAS